MTVRTTEDMESTTKEKRQITHRDKIKRDVMTLLGNQMVDVELDNEHLDLAIDLSIEKLRQRSDGAVEENFMFLTLQPDQTTYTLPDQVQEVRKIYRRGVGAYTTGGSAFDPFEAAFSNIYLLQSGRTGGLATWDLFSQYQETIGRIFGSEVNFVWHLPTRQLEVVRKVRHEEDVALHVYLERDEDVILTNPYMRPWCRDYAYAKSKFMLGEARSKYTSGLPGPQGIVTLNGEQLKQEAIQELERLEIELTTFVTSEDGMPFTKGG